MTAQEQAPTLAEMFPIPEEARRLERFIGEWDVEGTLTIGADALPMTGEWIFMPAAGGWGVRATMRCEVEGLGSYEEDDLVGFDRETGMFHVYSVTNSAAVHDHVSSWSDADTFEFEYEGLQDSKPYREIGFVRFIGGDTMEITSTDHVDGAIASQMVVTLKRSR